MEEWRVLSKNITEELHRVQQLDHAIALLCPPSTPPPPCSQPFIYKPTQHTMRALHDIAQQLLERMHELIEKPHVKPVAPPPPSSIPMDSELHRVYGDYFNSPAGRRKKKRRRRKQDAQSIIQALIPVAYTPPPSILPPHNLSLVPVSIHPPAPVLENDIHIDRIESENQSALERVNSESTGSQFSDSITPASPSPTLVPWHPHDRESSTLNHYELELAVWMSKQGKWKKKRVDDEVLQRCAEMFTLLAPAGSTHCSLHALKTACKALNVRMPATPAFIQRLRMGGEVLHVEGEELISFQAFVYGLLELINWENYLASEVQYQRDQARELQRAIPHVAAPPPSRVPPPPIATTQSTIARYKHIARTLPKIAKRSGSREKKGARPRSRSQSRSRSRSRSPGRPPKNVAPPSSSLPPRPATQGGDVRQNSKGRSAHAQLQSIPFFLFTPAYMRHSKVMNVIGSHRAEEDKQTAQCSHEIAVYTQQLNANNPATAAPAPFHTVRFCPTPPPHTARSTLSSKQKQKPPTHHVSRRIRGTLHIPNHVTSTTPSRPTTVPFTSNAEAAAQLSLTMHAPKMHLKEALPASSSWFRHTSQLTLSGSIMKVIDLNRAALPSEHSSPAHTRAHSSIGGMQAMTSRSEGNVLPVRTIHAIDPAVVAAEAEAETQAILANAGITLDPAAIAAIARANEQHVSEDEDEEESKEQPRTRWSDQSKPVSAVVRSETAQSRRSSNAPSTPAATTRTKSLHRRLALTNNKLVSAHQVRVIDLTQTAVCPLPPSPKSRPSVFVHTSSISKEANIATEARKLSVSRNAAQPIESALPSSPPPLPREVTAESVKGISPASPPGSPKLKIVTGSVAMPAIPPSSLVSSPVANASPSHQRRLSAFSTSLLAAMDQNETNQPAEEQQEVQEQETHIPIAIDRPASQPSTIIIPSSPTGATVSPPRSSTRGSIHLSPPTPLHVMQQIPVASTLHTTQLQHSRRLTQLWGRFIMPHMQGEQAQNGQNPAAADTLPVDGANADNAHLRCHSTDVWHRSPIASHPPRKYNQSMPFPPISSAIVNTQHDNEQAHSDSDVSFPSTPAAPAGLSRSVTPSSESDLEPEVGADHDHDDDQDQALQEN